MARRVLALVFLITVLLVALSVPAGAQYGERITSYDVDITIQRGGDLAVVETIAYDFGATQHHGIDRAIPVRFHYDDRYDRVYPIRVESVTGSPGTPAQYKTESVSGGRKRIRIGDPDRTITGPHTYTIRYRVRGAMNGFREHDELYWNAIAGDSAVPTDRATIHVHAPVAITNVACYAGPTQSKLPCASATSDGTDARFAHDELSSFDGVSIVVAIPTGVVPTPKPILEERWSFQRAFELTGVTIAMAGALLAIVVAFVGRLLWTKGRDRQAIGSGVEAAFATGDGADEPVPMLHRVETPVEFLPPDGIRPGEIGTLVDEVANPLDVTATIVDLAVRGYVKIEEIPKEGWFGKPDWKLTALRSPDDALKSYERSLLQGIFGRVDAGDEKKLSELKYQFSSKLAKVQDALYRDVVDAGWFPRRPDSVRSRWHLIGIALLVVGIASTVAAAVYTHWALIPIPIAIGGLVLTVGAHDMPHRSSKGTGMLRRVRGFRRFIESPTETGHAQFDERKNLFSEYLPYAIVFGCTEKWAKAFADLGREVDTSSWYVSTRPFTFVGFSDAMDGFTTTTAGTIAAATPSSSGSSGFGGGGFSGGGGGGGSVGSW